MGLVLTLLLISAATLVVGGHPLTRPEVTDAAKIVQHCTTGRLECALSALVASIIPASANMVHRDYAIHTINDLQHNFFLESALVVGGEMTLEANLRDNAPKRAFMSASAAKSLPELTSSNVLNLLKHFAVSPSTELATSVATAAHLCGYGALPGERMTCAASADAVANFVASELGSEVHVLSTTNTPAAAPAVRSPVTIVHVVKGSLADGKTIVVCHAVSFPSALHYCHRVTGTRVIIATLKPAEVDSSDIKAVGVCHINTSLWLSTHPAFRALNIPRGKEACHWLIDSDVLFYPAANNAAHLA